MLWEVDPSAWLFLAVITVFNLVLNFITLIVNEFGNTDTLVVSIIINALVLIYIMLPGVKEAFGTTQ
jgi:ABC-type multidrug transport system permease subunit